MTLWFMVGLTVWILCVLFILAVLKGGHRIRGHGYEQKLYSRSKVNIYRRFGKKRCEEASKNKKESMPAHK